MRDPHGRLQYRYVRQVVESDTEQTDAIVGGLREYGEYKKTHERALSRMKEREKD